jgi:hypothetical protein
MAKKFSGLRARMPPEAQARIEAKAQAMLAEMPLNELRQARGLSQKMLADVLHVQQPYPSPNWRSVQICTSLPYAATSKPWEANWKWSRAFPMVR